jgi:hypothetical protein
MPKSLKALSLAALLCLPAAAFALYLAYAWCVVWDEDIDKSFMSEIPGYRAPLLDRALAHIRAWPVFFLYIAPLAFGALLPVAILCVVTLLRLLPSLSVRQPGPLLFMFLVLCSGGLAFFGIINQPFGLALLPLSALAVAASFIPFVPRTTHEPNVA